MQTKTKLTVTIDSEVLPRAKEHAHARGVSLSSIIEQILRDAVEADAPAEGASWAAGKTLEEISAHIPHETPEERQARWEDESLSFVARWMGQLHSDPPLTDEDLDNARYEYLSEKYGPFNDG